MTENYASAVAAIESADLSAPIYRTARRLLDLAADHDGYLEITPTALSEIGGGGAEGTMRTHLIQLACWGILAYNSSQKHGRIAIRFTAYPMPIVEEWPHEEIAPRSNQRAASTILIAPRSNSRAGRAEPEAPPPPNGEVVIVGRSNSRAGRAEMIAPRSEPTEAVSVRALHDQNCALHDQNCALDDQNRALDDQKGGRGVGWLVGIDPTLPKNDLTNQPTRLNGSSAGSPAAGAINQVEQARSAALLLAAGVMPRNAKRLAAEHPFERVQRVIGYWWDGKGTKFEDNPGLVVRLLDDWHGAGVPLDLPRSFLSSELYRRHRTPEQLAADEATPSVVRTGLEPDPTPPPAAPPAETDPLATLWAQTLACYQEHTRLLLSETRLTAINADQAIISGPQRMETIFSRMAWKILKDLRLSGLPVTGVIFQPQEVTDA